GLVVSIYIHEMGHVAALRRLGINASAPMFIPGLGAVILMKQQFLSPREDARVGLAGPIWGLGTAVAALAVFLITGQPIWGAIAHVGAWINLFNLLPVWQLDGSRGFHSLTRTHRWIVAAAVAAMWFATAEGLLFLILILTVVRALEKKPAQEPDSTALAQFVFLVITLSALCMIKVPMN
ncbi:site-2 protease family protein, partial [Candidatus Sumerlaeota bacterium]|nr:site-2 protease family protein [Candidatus Sumerlaeota bacterium]